VDRNRRPGEFLAAAGVLTIAMEQPRSILSTEHELIRRLISGDENAVSDLARLYGPRIHQVALRYVKDTEEAREITQDVLFKAVAKIARFRGDSALFSWLYRVTVNTSVSRLRRLRALRASEMPVAVLRDSNDGACMPEAVDRAELADQLTFRGQMRQRLVAAVQALPPIYRAPVILRDVRGLSTGEASSALRLNDQTLKSRLHRGRRLLRRALSDFADGLA
jgi:RNA polymerase sigma-70 factor, ECF subfamily